MNWPVGSSHEFLGLVDLASDQLHTFHDRTGERRSATDQLPWQAVVNQTSGEPIADSIVATGQTNLSFTKHVIVQAAEELELLRMAGHVLDYDQFLAGQQTPVFFGSALTNYGIELFLKGFIELCPAPNVRWLESGPNHSQDDFSGFIFKIQANLDPMHRDRVAFVRICSGRFERDMEVVVERTGKCVRLPRALKIFGRDRQTMEEAFPGDIIGVVCPGELRLGDTIYQGAAIHYPAVPQFSPEVFARVTCPDTSRRKQFDRGLQQLVEEGAIQLFLSKGRQRDAILAAVGQLQFDVVQFRLETEYNSPSKVEWLPFKFTRWFQTDQDESTIKCPYGAKLVVDSFGSDAILLRSEWDLRLLERENPKITFEAIHETRIELPHAD